MTGQGIDEVRGAGSATRVRAGRDNLHNRQNTKNFGT